MRPDAVFTFFYFLVYFLTSLIFENFPRGLHFFRMLRRQRDQKPLPPNFRAEKKFVSKKKNLGKKY